LSFSSAVQAATLTVSSTILILARDDASAFSGYSGLQGYGIPYQVVTVPSTGASLPALNSSATNGNFGAIVVLGEVAYDYNGVFQSALTAVQWATMYSYQEAFGVRMVRLDVFPNADFGCTAINGNANDEPIYFTNTTGFPTASLKTGTGASMTTSGLWHYPATITNTTIAWEIARFGTVGTAAVINQIGKRQQMAFFVPFATDWSPTSNFVQHSWIHWATRGLYIGFRRLYFNTQIDDMFLATELYQPAGVDFRIRPGDLDAHKAWIPTINAKMPAGSSYFPEIGHNGNGDIETAVLNDPTNLCNPKDAIEYPEQIDTALEFQKPLGSGTNIWPNTPSTYIWSLNCAKIDTLEQWFGNTANRDVFAHLSHTFTHMGLNNATYSDTVKEIQFNKAWMAQVGISSAQKFSNGLIPPAITGLHNGDAIRAWMENGIKYVVGDNTRPVLRNSNTFWPLISTVAANGYAGLVIVPRWATTIYYNCDTPSCTLAEWIATSAGSGDFQNLLKDARATNGRNLLGLHWDPYMFHQANLRYTDMNPTVVNGSSQKLSLFQIWVETIVNEITRLVNWPMISLKHDDIALKFMDRMTRDQCSPKMSWVTDGSTITGVTITANNNRCTAKIPLSMPGSVTSTAGATLEKVGNDPSTYWVTMAGNSRSYTLSSPIPV